MLPHVAGMWLGLSSTSEFLKLSQKQLRNTNNVASCQLHRFPTRCIAQKNITPHITNPTFAYLTCPQERISRARQRGTSPGCLPIELIRGAHTWHDFCPFKPHIFLQLKHSHQICSTETVSPVFREARRDPRSVPMDTAGLRNSNNPHTIHEWVDTKRDSRVAMVPHRQDNASQRGDNPQAQAALLLDSCDRSRAREAMLTPLGICMYTRNV